MSNRLLCVAAVLVAGLPAVGAAQSTRSALWPVASIGAGVATAQGTGAGFNALGSLEFGGTRGPLQLRLDAQLSQWRTDAVTSRLGAFTANVVADLRPAGVRPYVVAGGGGYAGAGTGIRPGWNAGLGFVVPIRGREFLLETRYHEWQRPDATGSAAAARYFVPLAVRLRF